MAGGRPAGTVGLALVLPRPVAVELLDDQRRHEQLQLALELQDTQGHDPFLAISPGSSVSPVDLLRRLACSAHMLVPCSAQVSAQLRSRGLRNPHQARRADPVDLVT